MMGKKLKLSSDGGDSGSKMQMRIWHWSQAVALVLVRAEESDFGLRESVLTYILFYTEFF
jgi:hypothetical protein